MADFMAVNYVDRIFDNPNFYSGIETIIGIFAYSLQIYMDFSGYTDIAIGLALVLGFRLKPNFNSPYKATSTSDFWKRWHISLSTWLQEYLYFPLGGNRNGTIGSYIAVTVIILFLVLLSGKFWLLFAFFAMAAILAILGLMFRRLRQAINTNINLMVTMLLGGLWHGSSWLFLIWGGLNGLGLIIHKFWAKISPFKNNDSWFVKVSMILLTLTFISFTRIFFRSSDLMVVKSVFDRIQNHLGPELWLSIIKAYAPVFGVIGLGYAIHWIPEAIKEKYRHWFASAGYATMVAITIVVVFTMYQLMSGDMQPFIYFQF